MTMFGWWWLVAGLQLTTKIIAITEGYISRNSLGFIWLLVEFRGIRSFGKPSLENSLFVYLFIYGFPMEKPLKTF